jgi:hypothetical protein
MSDTQEARKAMAATGNQVFEMKTPYDSSSKETTSSPEIGLVDAAYPTGYGDIYNDQADLQWLGKVRIPISIKKKKYSVDLIETRLQGTNPPIQPSAVAR